MVGQTLFGFEAAAEDRTRTFAIQSSHPDHPVRNRP